MNAPKIKVWDIATRFFHWALVAAIVTAIVAVEMEEMDIHMWAGKTVLALVLFRLMWGFWGSSTSRFVGFLKSPRLVLDYIKAVRAGNAPKFYGHNPAGGWMIVALLLALLVQTTLGLFSDDEMFAKGPLAHKVDYYTSQFLSEVHEGFAFVVLALAGVHILAIVIYRLKGDNLVVPMVTGSKEILKKAGDTPPVLRSMLLALATFALAASAVYYIITAI